MLELSKLGPLIEHPGSTGQIAELNGARVYVKRPRALQPEHVLNELRFLTDTRDVPGVLQPITALEDSALVYPYLERDVAASAGLLATEDVRDILLRLLNTLEHLHEKGIVHADLKLENVRLDEDGQTFLADFGRAHRLGEHLPNVLSSLAQHYAPDLTIGPQSDIYALGVLAYQLLFGFHFLRDFQLRGRDFLRVPEAQTVDARLLEFIRMATNVDAGYRLKSAEHARDLLLGAAAEMPIVIEPIRLTTYFLGS